MVNICLFPEMNVSLWEWYLYVIIIEGVVDTLKYSAVVKELSLHPDPDKHFQYQGRVTKFLQYNLDTFLLVDAVELGNCIEYKLSALSDVCTVSHSDVKDMTFPAMVARHVLIVFCKQLRIGEGND